MIPFIVSPARRSLLAALAALTLLIVDAFTVPASAELNVKGDTAAWREVIAAYGKLSALSGYRIKGAMAQGSMVVDVAPASKAMHSTIQSPNGGAEVIVVGAESRYRTTVQGAPTGWRCMSVPRTPRLDDPTAFQGTVDISRAPDAAIDGAPMHVYVYTMQGTPGTAMTAADGVKTTLYVGSENGLPRRIVLTTPRGDQAIDYYDYGAAVQITLPPCSDG
jgi:hypothetical protein